MKSDPQNEANAYANMDDTGGLRIGHFVTAVRDRSRIVWVCLVLCVLVACAVIIIPMPQYTITILVYPSTSSQDKSLGSTLSALAGPLAGLIGSSSSGDVQPFDIYQALLSSPKLADRVIKKDPEILQRVFYKEWDPASKTFKPPHDILSITMRTFNWIFGLPTYTKPNATRLAYWLSENLSITAVNSTSIQQIQFSTPYPQFGTRFFKELNDEADAIIREQATKLTDAQIAYLENKLSQVQTVDYRQTILGLLSAQETTRMSINKDLPYASAVLQSSYSSDLPTWPNPLVLLAVAVFVGLSLGAVAAITAAMLWPEGRQRYVKSRYGVVTAYRKLVWRLTTPSRKAPSAAE
jgi:subunit length determinant Wzz-like protein